VRRCDDRSARLSGAFAAGFSAGFCADSEAGAEGFSGTEWITGFDAGDADDAGAAGWMTPCTRVCAFADTNAAQAATVAAARQWVHNVMSAGSSWAHRSAGA
jgi:hypothetical protein